MLKHPLLTRKIQDPDGMGLTYPGAVNLSIYPWLEPYCVEMPADDVERESLMKRGHELETIYLYAKPVSKSDTKHWFNATLLTLFTVSPLIALVVTPVPVRGILLIGVLLGALCGISLFTSITGMH